MEWRCVHLGCTVIRVRVSLPHISAQGGHGYRVVVYKGYIERCNMPYQNIRYFESPAIEIEAMKTLKSSSIVSVAKEAGREDVSILITCRQGGKIDPRREANARANANCVQSKIN